MNWNNSVHATVQDKGGIGKTLSASMLMQYALDRGFNIEGVDADPQAPKLSRITALNVPLLPLILHGEIQQSAFDPAFTHIIKSTTATLIDAGSGAFLPLLKYMSDNRLYRVLERAGKQLYYHVVVISGPEKQKTAEGAEKLLQRIEGTSAKVVLWQNEKEGIPMFEGKPLEKTDWYKKYQAQIAGIVKIVDRNNSAFTADFLAMMEEAITFKEIMEGKSLTFDFMRQLRIETIFTDVFAELDQVFKLKTRATAATAVEA